MKKRHNTKQQITIIGAGMAGCFLAICLSKLGFSVQIFEARPDLRQNNGESGRSFNLTLYYRGIQAMKQMGLWDDVRKISVLAEGNVCHPANKDAYFDPFDNTNEVLYTVHRTSLNKVLLAHVEKAKGISVRFNEKCVQIDRNTSTIIFEHTKTKKLRRVQSDIIIGADGVNSIVRTEIQKGQQPHHTQEYSDWGYKEVHVSPELARELSLQLQATHTWPRPNSLLIAFPNPDSSFTLMFNLPLQGENSFATLQTKDAIERYIRTNFAHLIPLLPQINEAFLEKPTGNFVTVYTTPWYYKDTMFLVGDAAHGVIPFYGQGMCAAFEDCLTLFDLIQKHTSDFSKILPLYQQIRKPNTDVLGELSKENFIELRDKARSPYFIAKDKMYTLLHRLFPSVWLPPLYMLIAHGTLPYAEALEKFKRQEKLARWTGLNILAGIVAGGFFFRALFSKERSV